MARKFTNKEVKNWGVPVLSIGYCAIQNLLNHISREGWTESRAYGWRSDIYIVNGVIISTGYAPVSGIKVPYELTKKYEDKALAIYGTIGMNWQEKDNKVSALLSNFINEVLTGEGEP